MRLRCLLLALILAPLAERGLACDALPSYYDRYRFLLAPSTSFADGLVGFANPANLALLHSPELRFIWSSEIEKLSGFEEWGLYTGVRGLGFSVQQQQQVAGKVTDYRLSAGLGGRAGALGLAYGWSSGDAPCQREEVLVVSSVLRPARFFSLGVTGNYALGNSAYEWVGEIGLRPFGTPFLTVFADAAWRKDARVEDVPWSAGAAVRIMPAVDVVGRYFDSESFTVGLTFNLGRSGVATQSYLDRNQEYAGQVYGVRLGGLQPGVSTGRLTRGRYYVPVTIRGELRYLKYAFFDDKSRRFYEILSDIDAATRDHRVSALAVNLSGARMAPEHAWEVREALRQAQEAGKTIVVFIDNAGMAGYHLASVADHIVMDPKGMLLLPGYRLNRTYFSGSLTKMGLAFDEWRLFKYKSAAEALSRESMSDADREQLQAFVDDWYESTRAEVTASRHLTAEQFDRIIDEKMLFTADSALAAGLVDTLARWSDLDRVMRSVTRRALKQLGSGGLLDRALAPQDWGAPPRIALVYGLGACDMDRGIRARWLERQLLKLARDPGVEAVVFRVDSPGGDPLASDLVAEALKTLSRKKPVVVSQGQVAGSGGYWISMYADTIVAGPNTVTGSIGVIGGWLYNDGIGDKLGMTSDHVQRGAHADYDAGIRLPILGTTIPARKLTDEERSVVEAHMKELYQSFVQSVARGRNLALAEVNRLGEGRIYSGLDAKDNGLVDEIGGLLFALEIARKKAGISAGDEIQVDEHPSRRGLLSLPWTNPVPLGSEDQDPVVEALRQISQAGGRPLPLILPGSYPEVSE